MSQTTTSTPMTPVELFRSHQFLHADYRPGLFIRQD